MWRLVLAVLVLVPFERASAQSAWSLLGEPRTMAIMRHALAPGNGDPLGFALEDCTTQRNLDDVGRKQAITLGRSMKAAGLSFDHVLTSQWCRTRDTATLLDVGPVEDAPMLNSFYEDRSTEDKQMTELRRFLASLVTAPEESAVVEEDESAIVGHEAGDTLQVIIVDEAPKPPPPPPPPLKIDGDDRKVLLMVTHQVNITALTGRWIDSGSVFILQVDEAGEVEVLSEVLAPIAR